MGTLLTLLLRYVYVIVGMHIHVMPNRGSRPSILLRESYREGKKVKKRTHVPLQYNGWLTVGFGMEIISATEQLPSNATGRFMGDMQAAISRYSSAQLSERVKDAMELKANKGLYPSYAPVGYLNDLATRTIVPDPNRASIIGELFEAYAEADSSLSALVEWARKRGLTSRKGNAFRKSTIHKLLTNPIYCGIIR